MIPVEQTSTWELATCSACRRCGGHQLRILVAGRASAGIGVAGVDDHRRRLAAVRLQGRAIELDRRRGELVLGEHRGARHRPPVIGRKQGHVEPAPLDPGMAAGRDEASGGGDAHFLLPTHFAGEGDRTKSVEGFFGLREENPATSFVRSPSPANAGEDECSVTLMGTLRWL